MHFSSSHSGAGSFMYPEAGWLGVQSWRRQQREWPSSRRIREMRPSLNSMLSISRSEGKLLGHVGLKKCACRNWVAYIVFSGCRVAGLSDYCCVYIGDNIILLFLLFAYEWYVLVPVQATLGPCTKDKPGMFDLVGRAKWEAWNQLGSMEQVSISYLMCMWRYMYM